MRLGVPFLSLTAEEKETSESVAPMSNVYAAGEGHPIFSMSLPRAYNVDRLTDFRAIEGLPGIFLANQLDMKALESAYDRDSQWVSTKVQGPSITPCASLAFKSDRPGSLLGSPYICRSVTIRAISKGAASDSKLQLPMQK